jgi:sigma-B regulation protein RsbU (phosphoserine phosphatase)
VVRAIASEHVSPADVCAAVNRVMCGKLDRGRFITFFYCVLDSAAGTLTWSNAGHNPAMVQCRDGSQHLLSASGMVLGMFPDALYTESSLPLRKHDRVVLYTDGITEAERQGEEAFGDERLRSVVANQATLGAALLRDAIFTTVSDFCEGHFRDDATVIVLAAGPGETAAAAAAAKPAG